MKKILLATVIILSVVSCGAISTITKKQPSLVNTKWVLVDNTSGKTPTLIVESARITGNGGCNNYFSEVVLNSGNGNFVLGNIASTKMACNNMNIEQNYFDVLQQANKYTVKNGILELYKDNLLLLRFKKLEK
jgi:heat shock protein HslJ